MTLPAPVSTVSLDTGYTWITPDDGCPGAPLQPQSWGYVEVGYTTTGCWMVGTHAQCSTQGNCGASCGRL